MTHEQRATKVVEDHAQATKRDWSATDHRLYAIVLAALRAAPPAPAPELVALVQRVRVAHRNKHAAAVWDTVAQEIAARRLDDELDALLAWTPAPHVEPPARPETAAPTPAPNVEKPVPAVEKVVWIVADYPSGGVRGVYHTQAEAESGIAEIRSYHEDLVRSDFTVQTERIRGSAKAAPTPAPTRELSREHIAALRDLADDLESIVAVVSSRDGDATPRQYQRAAAVRAALAALSSPVGETSNKETK